MEKHILRRVYPHIQVVKLPGRHGQYGTKGQAMYFTQNLDDAVKQVIDVLPCKIDEANIAIVTEEIETDKNGPIHRELKIRLDVVR